MYSVYTGTYRYVPKTMISYNRSRFQMIAIWDDGPLAKDGFHWANIKHLAVLLALIVASYTIRERQS
jgi:hypothetical protein